MVVIAQSGRAVDAGPCVPVTRALVYPAPAGSDAQGAPA